MQSFGKLLCSTALVAAVSIGGAFSLSTEAQARATGFSSLIVSDLSVTDLTDNTRLDVGDLDSDTLAINNDSTVSATLNGSGTVSSLGPIGTPIDVLQQCVGDCPVAPENDFTRASAGDPTPTFSRGDTNLEGAIITGVVPGDPTVTASHVAETQVNGPNVGTSSSEIGTGSDFQFVLDSDRAVRFDFNATVLAQVETDATGSSARASWGYGISIVDSGGTEIFTWEPQGSAGGITGGTEISDTLDLNDSISVNLPNRSDDFNLGGGIFSFSAQTDLLPGNELLTLNIRSTAGSSASSTEIPSPSTITLLGLAFGLLGLIGYYRREQPAS